MAGVDGQGLVGRHKLGKIDPRRPKRGRAICCPVVIKVIVMSFLASIRLRQ